MFFIQAVKTNTEQLLLFLLFETRISNVEKNIYTIENDTYFYFYFFSINLLTN